MRVKCLSLTIGLLMVLSTPFSTLVYGQRLIIEDEGKTSAENIWQENVNELRFYLNSLLKERQQLKSEKEELERRIEELSKTPASLPRMQTPTFNQKAEIQALKKEIENLQQEKQSLEEKINSLGKGSRRETAPPAGVTYSKDQVDKLLGACEKDKARIEGNLLELKDKIKQQERELAQLKTKPKVSSCDQIAQENKSLNERIWDTENRLNLSLQELADLREEKMQMLREKEIADSLANLQLGEGQESIPTENINHELLAYQMAKNSDYAQAIIEYLQALKYDPNNKDIYFNLGVLYSKLKDYQRAVTYYKKVLSFDPKDKDALLNLSRTYKRLSNAGQSKHYYNLYLKQTKP